MPTTPNIDLEQEKKDILNAYRGLLRSCRQLRDREDTRQIRKAFDVAVEAHKEHRRKSGEPYIFHPIAVARICTEEIGLGPTAIVAALLHDTVEDTDMTLEDIERMFGEKVRTIIDGLTKIDDVFDHSQSIQAENFRKMLLTLSDDVRVILIKLADRLHNMRTLDAMKKEKQLKIASETQFLFAPLAHRLGLYAIKSELEDLSLKYKEPEVYEEIETKLEKTREVRNRFIRRFVRPIKEALDEEGYSVEIKARTKSIYSIWKKMQAKNITFDEVYDIFAIRIIADLPLEREKGDCWNIYSIVTDFYQPNPDRLRDWISTPKGNGYESLHTTVMSPTGKWVEVQIRSTRMDEIAEKGYAAHWKYKESSSAESNLDIWLNQIRDLLENPETSALDFIDDFKLNLFSDEIFVFTPTGDLKTLPSLSTALDFAFEIHTEVGARCIGAKVNNKLVPLSQKLKSGDQIEILTSKKQRPKEDWLNFVVTARAKSKIKSALKEERKRVQDEGKEILQRKFSHNNIMFNSQNLRVMESHYKVNSTGEMYFRIAKGKLDPSEVNGMQVVGGQIIEESKKKVTSTEKKNDSTTTFSSKSNSIVIGDDQQEMDYQLAKCCNPIPGDDVFGFVTVNGTVKIHRNNCPNATQLLSKYAYRVVKAQWSSEELKEWLAGIRFIGIDDIGIVHKVTDVISKSMNINMRSVGFESHDGTFTGKIMAYVHDTEHLDQLMQTLGQIEGVRSVERMDPEETESNLAS